MVEPSADIMPDSNASTAAVSIPSFEPLSVESTTSHSSQSAVRVTSEMVYHLNCDAINQLKKDESVCILSETFEKTDRKDKHHDSRSYAPQLMILHGSGDINSALQVLIESLHNPFSVNAVATVLIEEGIRQEFEQRVIAQMHNLTESVSEHPNYLRMLQRLSVLNVDIIVAEINEVVPPMASPVLVCDCTHDVLGLGEGQGPTGAITMHTFRSPSEAIEKYRKERVPYGSSCIWNETLEGSYELVAAIKCSQFFFNCSKVDLSPIFRSFNADEAYVVIANGFHYETLRIYGQAKVIVFPISQQISSKPYEKGDELGSPISFLDE